MLYHGSAAFTTTHWSVVLGGARRIAGGTGGARKDFAALTGDPFTAFCGDRVFGQRKRRIITQGFFAQLLERRSLNAVRKEKGRLRSYLLGALKYFLADEQRRAMAIKRGKGQRLIPLEELRAERPDRDGTSRSNDCRNDLRTPVGFDGSGARAQPIKR